VNLEFRWTTSKNQNSAAPANPQEWRAGERGKALREKKMGTKPGGSDTWVSGKEGCNPQRR
jgi:hypothetical protein